MFSGSQPGVDYDTFVHFCQCASAGSAGRALTADEADDIFDQLVPEAEELMDFAQFKAALAMFHMMSDAAPVSQT